MKKLIAVLATGLFLFGMVGIVNAIPLTNDGFEQDFFGWETINSQDSSLFIDQSVYHSGNKSAELIMQYGGGGITQHVSFAPVSATIVEFSLWLLMPTAGDSGNKWFNMGIRALDGSGNELANNWSGIFGPYANWTLKSVSVVASVGTANIEIYAHTQNGSGMGLPAPLWIDDVKLSPDSVPEPTTMLLLGLGLIGLAGIRKRM